MLRAVFVDMDDTFVAPDKTIPAGNLRVLDLAHERGVQVVPCTGRSVAGLPPELVAHPACATPSAAAAPSSTTSARTVS